MFDNHAYNLMLQMTEEHKSLWRIKNEYTKDAGDCSGCKGIWEKLAKDKEDHINELSSLIKEHIK
ncbi:MAG: hypothetical protein O2794_00365 [bacterium]|nr:hypothetical protein [bacterium]